MTDLVIALYDMQPYVSDTHMKRRVVNYQLMVGSGHGEVIRYTQNTHIGSMGELGTLGNLFTPTSRRNFCISLVMKRTYSIPLFH